MNRTPPAPTDPAIHEQDATSCSWMAGSVGAGGVLFMDGWISWWRPVHGWLDQLVQVASCSWMAGSVGAGGVLFMDGWISWWRPVHGCLYLLGQITEIARPDRQNKDLTSRLEEAAEVSQRKNCGAQRTNVSTGLPFLKTELGDFFNKTVEKIYQDAQAKLSRLAGEAAKTGLQINIQKTEAMRIKEKQVNPLHLEGKNIKELDKFTYLGSVVDKHGVTEEDIKSRTNKARFAFNSLRLIWNSSALSILRWPQTISNEELWRRTEQTPIDIQIKKRKWGWIGHTLRKPPTDITRQSLKWNPQGKRKVGRPKQTWRRSMETETRSAGMTWTELKRDAQNRVRWRSVALAICSSGDPEA
ncbi:hypothetical protein EGW08_019944 [Elysia chlorotica]|uniref:Reverse transcriptase domain-containing protein n=1 Tax=Elysia chlorotica TaxID=188477 RepID=A0A433SSQ4_ELYCH|nr:hypothetical protein EGW08_019944 [Elysia chlorotica]